jgi:[ribosomal protein S5]-alanine N-acetyltransferase
VQVQTPTTSARVLKSWRDGLPRLAGRDVVLRDLRVADASSLFDLLTTEEVARFLSPPPSSPQGFERFIRWTADERRAGRHACFAMTLPASDAAIGILQVRSIVERPGTAEWGFALGSPFWGRGLFEDGAALALGFAFSTMGVHRLEACAAARNERGNRALQKLGALQQGHLRQSFRRSGDLDQVLWTIGAGDRASASIPSVRISH